MEVNLSTLPSRLRNITATNMATLFGLNKYESPAKLLESKRNPVQIDNNHVRRGKLREPSVVEAFNLDANMHVVRHEGGTIEHQGGLRIAATPDAFVKDTLNVVECKSVMFTSFEKWYEAVPTHYHLQVFTQMFIMDSEEGYIGALEEGDPRDCEYRFVAWKITLPDEVKEMMIAEVERFWNSVDNDELFRVNSKIKKRMMEILPTTSMLVFPLEVPQLRKEESDEQELSRILSLFQ